MKNRMFSISAVAAAALVTACGGGGGGNTVAAPAIAPSTEIAADAVKTFFAKYDAS